MDATLAYIDRLLDAGDWDVLRDLGPGETLQLLREYLAMEVGRGTPGAHLALAGTYQRGFARCLAEILEGVRQ